MATEEDNFDIDIYGDGGEDYHEEGQVEGDGQDQPIDTTTQQGDTGGVPLSASPAHGSEGVTTNGHETQPASNPHGEDSTSDVAHKIGSTDESAPDPLHLPKHAPQTQGLKRKEGSDDRLVDPGATTALFISDLPWWITDDDIRGWANQSECEDELHEITFSEHKVNGKSKGQAYILFKSPQAATAAKNKVESFGEGQKYRQKFIVSYTNPYVNPFKTLPKDGPLRTGAQANRTTTGGYSSAGGMGGSPQTGYSSNPTGGYRGRGGGYNSRGSISNVGGYNSRGGFQQPMPGSYQGGSGMNGFPPALPMAGIPPYNNFQTRGAMMGGGMRGGPPMSMRGGRGGMSPGGMMSMPMPGMNMGGMPPQMGGMGMGMPPMNGGMGMQAFQGGPPHYNPAFFAQQQAQGTGVADANWNPHGAKRTRQE